MLCHRCPYLSVDWMKPRKRKKIIFWRNGMDVHNAICDWWSFTCTLYLQLYIQSYIYSVFGKQRQKSHVKGQRIDCYHTGPQATYTKHNIQFASTVSLSFRFLFLFRFLIQFWFVFTLLLCRLQSFDACLYCLFCHHHLYPFLRIIANDIQKYNWFVLWVAWQSIKIWRILEFRCDAHRYQEIPYSAPVIAIRNTHLSLKTIWTFSQQIKMPIWRFR